MRRLPDPGVVSIEPDPFSLIFISGILPVRSIARPRDNEPEPGERHGSPAMRDPRIFPSTAACLSRWPFVALLALMPGAAPAESAPPGLLGRSVVIGWTDSVMRTAQGFSVA